MPHIGRTIRPAALLLSLLFLVIPQHSSASVPLKRILILFPYESNVPGFIDFETGFQSMLHSSMDYQFEFYVECMDLTRFPGEQYQDKLLEVYRAKYSDIKLDLVVAVQLPSLQFLYEYRPESFVNVPIILFSQDHRLLGSHTSIPDASVVSGKLDFAGTLALSMRLHPDTRRVFIVTGASKFDQALEDMARKELRSFESRVELEYLSGLPMDELIQRTSTLPEHSLVLYVAVFRDGSGKNFKSPDALALIAKQANAPIYSLSETYMGSGMVGGHLVDHTTLGANVGRTALRVFAGEKQDNKGSTEDDGNRYIFDSRQIKRWGIDEKSLPPDSEIRYREFSVWEDYRWQVIGIVSALLLETLLISTLIVLFRKQHRAELALQKAADEWQTTFDSTTDLIMLLDRDLRILRANKAVASFTSLSMEGIPGKYCYSVIHGTASPRDECPYSRMLESKKHEDTLFFDEKRNIWLFVSVDPILDEKGEITGLVHTVKDVTERKRAVEAIEASEEFNRAVLSSLQSSIAILDKNGVILAVNNAWEQFVAQNPNLDGLGPDCNYLDVCRRSKQEPSDSASQVLDGILSVLDGRRESFSLEYPFDSLSQSHWFLMQVMPFRNSDGGVVISHTDITIRKNAEMEAQLRREELTHVTRIVTIGELATSIAHEINQPMTAILCNAEAAQRFLSSASPDLDEVRAILADIIDDDRRAGEVIRRLRTLVRKETPSREAVAINDAVFETIALVRNTSQLRSIHITAELSSEARVVQGDRVQLQQVILNLILNAITAMKETPPNLRKLVVRSTVQDNRTVLVSIQDTGTGIPGSTLDRLFEPFYTTKPDGLGMGLSISQTIIKAHGGKIWAENNEDCGATFHFTLPLQNGGEQL